MQDDWKAFKRVTINAGLRWEYFGHWATRHQGVIPSPLFTPGSGATFAQQVASGTIQVRGDGYFANNTPNAVAPRIGLAWDMFGNGSTSIRVAYGVFHSRVGNLSYATSGGANTNAPAFGSPSLKILQPGAHLGYQLGSSAGYYYRKASVEDLALDGLHHPSHQAVLPADGPESRLARAPLVRNSREHLEGQQRL